MKKKKLPLSEKFQNPNGNRRNRDKIDTPNTYTRPLTFLDTPNTRIQDRSLSSIALTHVYKTAHFPRYP